MTSSRVPAGRDRPSPRSQQPAPPSPASPVAPTGRRPKAVLDQPFFQEFHEPAPLATAAENNVNALAFDRAGNLWAGTVAGPRVRIGGKWSTPPGSGAIGRVNALEVTPDGTVWIGANSGLWFGGTGGVSVVPELAGKPISALGRRYTRVVAAGPDGAWQKSGSGAWVRLPGRFQQHVRAVHPAVDGTVWVGTASGLYLLDPAGRKPVVRLGRPEELCSSNVHCIAARADGALAIGSTGGVDVYVGRKRVAWWSSEHKIPSRQVRGIAFAKDGTFWMATAVGLVQRDRDRWRLRHSRRWLASDDVRAVAVGSDGTVWAGGAGGVDAIRRRTLTLAEKEAYFRDMVLKRHIRPPGLVGPAVLLRAGDLSQSFIEDDDNDGEHTGMWLATESLRWAVTKDPSARENARKAFAAMEVLQQATGTRHFIARSVLPIGTAPRHEVDRTFTAEELVEMKRTDPREKPIEKRWIPTADGKWLWKRDASSDEVDGHLFGYAFYYNFAADAAERKKVAALVDRIVGGIVDNGFVLQDIDGKATRWGNWSPASLNGDPNWNEERFGNSTEILAHLGVALHVTGKAKYRDAARLLVEKHGYGRNMARLGYPTPAEATHINDQLLSMVFPNLFRHLVLPELKGDAELAMRGWRRTSRLDKSPFYDFVGATFGAETGPLDESVETLRRWPLDMVEWTVDNRWREDLVFDRAPGRDSDRIANRFPRDEMGLTMWDQEPWRAVIGRGGMREDKPVDWLLAYWMGRYWGWITPPTRRAR